MHKGARGIKEIEARETFTGATTKLDGLRPGDCYHGGLTVLSRSATRGNRGTQNPMARVKHTNGLRSTNPMYGREDAR